MDCELLDLVLWASKPGFIWFLCFVFLLPFCGKVWCVTYWYFCYFVRAAMCQGIIDFFLQIRCAMFCIPPRRSHGLRFRGKYRQHLAPWGCQLVAGVNLGREYWSGGTTGHDWLDPRAGDPLCRRPTKGKTRYWFTLEQFFRGCNRGVMEKKKKDYNGIIEKRKGI